MADKDYIKYLYTKDIELHDRINNIIEEILNGDKDEKTKNNLIKNLEYINDEFAKLESLEKFEKSIEIKTR
jgi:hypothetical protein